jgi:hypothetical protein
MTTFFQNNDKTGKNLSAFQREKKEEKKKNEGKKKGMYISLSFSASFRECCHTWLSKPKTKKVGRIQVVKWNLWIKIVCATGYFGDKSKY